MEISSNPAEVFKTKEELIEYLQTADIESDGGMFVITMEQFSELIAPEHDILLSDRLRNASETFVPLAVSPYEFDLLAGEDSPIEKMYELSGLEFQTSVFVVKNRPFTHLVALNVEERNLGLVALIFRGCFEGICECTLVGDMVVATGGRLNEKAMDVLSAVNMSTIDRDLLGSEVSRDVLDFALDVTQGKAEGTLADLIEKVKGVLVGL